jgi:hypothetical protein
VSLLSGRDRFRVVNALPMRMAGTHEVRLLARMLSLSHEIVVYRLLNVWSWAAGAWTPDGTWGEVVPAEVVEQLVGRGAPAAMARAGLGIELVVDGVPAVRLVRIDGAPDLTRTYRIAAQRRVAAAGRWRRYHEQRAGGRR